MICTNCKKTIPDDAEYCKYCGTPAPFSSGVGYHPETMFPAGTRGGAPASGSVEKALTEMEGRLNEKLLGLYGRLSPKRDLWRRIQSIAMVLLAAAIVAGAIMLVKANARIDQINGQLENAAVADSETQTSLETLAEIQAAQEQMQSDLDALTDAEQEAETAQEETAVSPACVVTFYSNYDDSGDFAGLKPVTMFPGGVLSLASLNVPDREGYLFTGWNTAADGTGKQYAPGGSIGYFGYDVELYAQWEEVDTEPTPTDNPGGV